MMEAKHSRGLSHILLFTLFLFGLFSTICGATLAQEPGQSEEAAISGQSQQWDVIGKSPGVVIVSRQWADPGDLLPAGDNPLEVAQDWLLEQGLEEGRNLYRGKLLYVSTGSAAINATPDDPGFIDSRLLAFQRAELEAKVKTAIFLGVDLTTSRGSSEREINPDERGQMEAIVKASPTLAPSAERLGVKDGIYKFFDKGRQLAEAKLDRALEESGVDVSAAKAEERRKQAAAQAERDKFARLRHISEASLQTSALAVAEVQGAQVIQSFEGSYHNNYQVVVITLWSLNLQRLVNSMQQGTAPKPLPIRTAKDQLIEQLPKKANELVCLTGVRAYINQDGEHVLLAFGQAGVRVLGGREDKAFELAGKKARLRAMGAIRTFMGEKVAFAASEELQEVLALYVDEYQEGGGSQEYKSISQFNEHIQAIAEKEKITGLHGLLTRELTHPFTDKPMVLKVMAWSPSSQAAAQDVKRIVRDGPDAVAPPPSRPQAPDVPARKGIISSGKGADEDAY
jgi:hypothetical protein